VYRLYVPFQGATLVPVRFSAGTYTHGAINLPRIDMVAARDTAGKLWLSIVNLDPDRPAQVAAAVDGIAPRGASGSVLTAATVDAHNSFDRPQSVVPRAFAGRIADGKLVFDMPPKATAVVAVD
jgi:alpha-N-arabinofuranosidase